MVPQGGDVGVISWQVGRQELDDKAFAGPGVYDVEHDVDHAGPVDTDHDAAVTDLVDLCNGVVPENEGSKLNYFKMK